jgi:P-type Cu+ transporter
LKKQLFNLILKKVKQEEIFQKVENLGYNVVTEKAELTITGMTCAACSARIEKGLKKLEGITDANVNLALERADVEYNPAAISPADLIQKVEKPGCGVALKSDEGTGEEQDHHKREIERQKP